MNTLVIMPTYNEAEGIEKVVRHLLATVPQIDLLIVDDNSPDGTGKIADGFAAEDTRVAGQLLHGNLGVSILDSHDIGEDLLVFLNDGSHALLPAVNRPFYRVCANNQNALLY